MYSTIATQDSSSDFVFDLSDHEPPEPVESWSLDDFQDIVPGQLS